MRRLWGHSQHEIARSTNARAFPSCLAGAETLSDSVDTEIDASHVDVIDSSSLGCAAHYRVGVHFPAAVVVLERLGYALDSCSI